MTATATTMMAAQNRTLLRGAMGDDDGVFLVVADLSCVYLDVGVGCRASCCNATLGVLSMFI